MELLQLGKNLLAKLRASTAEPLPTSPLQAIEPNASASVDQAVIAPVDQAVIAPILDHYVTTAPSVETAVNIFAGEWSSIFPAPYETLTRGTAKLFEDPRITWFLEAVGGAKGKTVLELGPLEGGHSYMLEQAGCAQVTAIEANTRAYLKCLVTKELFNLQRVHFLCEDFIEYLRQTDTKTDLCVASGVLYHMVNPVELLALLAQRCQSSLMIWTHYYDPTIISNSSVHAPKFREKLESEFMGFTHTLYRREYETALNWGGFCGGSASYSYWLLKEDILKALQHFGFSNIRINFDTPDHPNGPAFALVADRAS